MRPPGRALTFSIFRELLTRALVPYPVGELLMRSWKLDIGCWTYMTVPKQLCLSLTALGCAVRSPLGLDNCHSETWWLSTFPNGKKRSSVSQSCVQVASKLPSKCPEVVSKSLHSLSISSFSPHFLFIFSFSLHFLTARLPGCHKLCNPAPHQDL